MSKIELDLIELNPEVCDLPGFFRRPGKQLLEPMLKEKGLRIKLDISPDIPQLVSIDETKLHQILINILYNALKFTNRGLYNIYCRHRESR